MRILSLLLGASLLVAAPLAGSAQTGGPILNKITQDELAAMIRDFGYRAEIVQGKTSPYIHTGMSGYDVYVYFYNCKDDGCGSLQISTSFKGSDSMTVGLANKWNAKWRYARAYVEPSNGNFYFEYDFLMAGITKQFIKENLSLYEDELAKLEKLQKEENSNR